MKYRGSEFYENQTNFKRYMDRRKREENANDTLEKPVILELIDDVNGLKVLDLGCGDGRFGLELFEKGCTHYFGIEGSKNMVKAAQQSLIGTNSHVEHILLEEWNPPKQEFDLVISRLVLHYIKDLESIFYKVHNALKPNGRFVFSVEHPVITSNPQTSGVRTNWIVDQYFAMGYRKQEWLGGTVYKYHRTVEEYFKLLQKTGFIITNLRESHPMKENFKHEDTYYRRMRIPLFLFLSGIKK